MFDQDTVFVDIETTGGNATRDRIIEVAILTMRDGRIISEWQSLINPSTYIPENIQNLTGISNDMVIGSPSFEDISLDIYERLSGCVFVAHNARFDYGFLKNEFRRCNIQFRAPVLCTVKLSRNLFPQHKRHNLDSIILRHGLKCEIRHRAIGDARVLFDFMCSLYSLLDVDEVNRVIKKLLKRPSLPQGLIEDDIDVLPEKAGVYKFFNDDGCLLYIGKSINIRKRVLSHFANDHANSKDMKISRQIKSIEYIQTAGELGAFLLESRLIKKELPIYNKRLRRYDSLVSLYWDADDIKSMPKVVTSSEIEPGHISKYFGLFKSRKKLTDTLRKLSREHGLCLKLIGLEKGEGACFAHQLNQCYGVCVGKETLLQHQARLLQALLPLKNQVWPFDGRIGVRESSIDNELVEIHVLDNWCYLGTANDESELYQLQLFESNKLSFDLDTYHILIRYFKKNKRSSVMKISPCA